MKHEVCRSGFAIGIKHEAGGVSSEPGEITEIVIDEVLHAGHDCSRILDACPLRPLTARSAPESSFLNVPDVRKARECRYLM
jgi:hypothetical protein